MDSAESDPVHAALQAQGQKLHHQEEQLAMVHREVTESSRNSEAACATLSAQLNYVITQLQVLEQIAATRAPGTETATAAPPESPAPPAAPRDSQLLRLSSPECFSSESGDCRPFLVQCELHFEFQASAFAFNCANIAYIISYLSGHAKVWATAEWTRRSTVCNSLPLFLETFKKKNSVYHSRQGVSKSSSGPEAGTPSGASPDPRAPGPAPNPSSSSSPNLVIKSFKTTVGGDIVIGHPGTHAARTHSTGSC
uniref:DUF4939 domain-containing protein n=1 Tax=Seriola dumerili TaxID=41447 RepID=A0A3B4V6J1_SERDU